MLPSSGTTASRHHKSLRNSTMGEPRDGAPPRQSNEGNAVEPSSQNTPLIAGESQRASGEGVSTAGALGMPNTTKANHLTHMTESVPRGGRDGGSTGRGDAEGRRRAASVFRGGIAKTRGWWRLRPASEIVFASGLSFLVCSLS